MYCQGLLTAVREMKVSDDDPTTVVVFIAGGTPKVTRDRLMEETKVLLRVPYVRVGYASVAKGPVIEIA